MVVNIAETLKKAAKEKIDQVGLIEAKTGRSVTFGELDLRSDGYAAYLKDEGIYAGDTVILMVAPSAEFICLTFALFKLGTPVILIDPGMLSSAQIAENTRCQSDWFEKSTRPKSVSSLSDKSIR